METVNSTKPVMEINVSAPLSSVAMGVVRKAMSVGRMETVAICNVEKRYAVLTPAVVPAANVLSSTSAWQMTVVCVSRIAPGRSVGAMGAAAVVGSVGMGRRAGSRPVSKLSVTMKMTSPGTDVPMGRLCSLRWVQ